MSAYPLIIYICIYFKNVYKFLITICNYSVFIHQENWFRTNRGSKGKFFCNHFLLSAGNNFIHQGLTF